MWRGRSTWGRFDRPIGPLAIYQSRDAQRVFISQCRWKKLLWGVLVRDGAHKPPDGRRADRRRAGIRCRRVGSAVNDRATHFDARWVAVDDHPADRPL